jgi:hypothetical protein
MQFNDKGRDVGAVMASCSSIGKDVHWSCEQVTREGGVPEEHSNSACWHCGSYAAAFKEFSAHKTDQHYTSDDYSDCGDVGVSTGWPSRNAPLVLQFLQWRPHRGEQENG